MTDPMAQWSGAKGPANFYYSTNYLVDVEEGIIVDVEASPSTIKAEMQTTRTMIERTEQTHQIKPDRLMADVAYGKAANLGYLVEEKDIEPHIPVWDKSERSDGTFSRSDFTWIDEENEYLCPRGQRLRSTGYVTPKDTLLYRSRVGDCADCPDKPRCCPNTPYRKIPRSIHERARDLARAICDSEEYRNHSFNLRKKVEMRFGHMKQILNFRRLRLRGLHSANDEFLLVATAQNLRSMARIRGRAPPEYRGSVPAMC